MNLKKILPGIAAVVVAVAISTFMSNGGFALFKGPPSDAEIEKLLVESGVDKTYSALKEFFPEDAAQWRDDLSDLIQQRRKGVHTTTNALDVGIALRRKHSAALTTTPDTLLIQVMRQQSALYRIFQNDTDACNRFLMEGGHGLDRAERRMLTPVLNDGAILFEAMHAGLTSPVSREPSTDADWLEIFSLMTENGASDADIQLVAAPDPNNPALCGAFLNFIEALADAEFEGADRVRAEMAVAFISA